MKGPGYLISIVGILLPGTAAWKAGSQDPALQLCLVAGMATSILGTGLPCRSYRRDEA